MRKFLISALLVGSITVAAYGQRVTVSGEEPRGLLFDVAVGTSAARSTRSFPTGRIIAPIDDTGRVLLYVHGTLGWGVAREAYITIGQYWVISVPIGDPGGETATFQAVMAPGFRYYPLRVGLFVGGDIGYGLFGIRDELGFAYRAFTGYDFGGRSGVSVTVGAHLTAVSNSTDTLHTFGAFLSVLSK